MMNTELSLNELIDWLEHNTDLSTPCEGCGKVIEPGKGHKMIVGLPARPDGGPYRFYTQCIRCIEMNLLAMQASEMTRGRA